MNIEEMLKDIHNIQRIEVPEQYINKQIKDRGLAFKIAIFDRYFTLNTGNGIEAHLSYHSHRLDSLNEEISIALRVLRVKPFYYGMSLPLLSKRFPFLEYNKDTDKTKYIVCNINKMSGFDEIPALHIHHFRHINIKDIKFEEGKIVIELSRV